MRTIYCTLSLGSLYIKYSNFPFERSSSRSPWAIKYSKQISNSQENIAFSFDPKGIKAQVSVGDQIMSLTVSDHV